VAGSDRCVQSQHCGGTSEPCWSIGRRGRQKPLSRLTTEPVDLAGGSLCLSAVAAQMATYTDRCQFWFPFFDLHVRNSITKVLHAASVRKVYSLCDERSFWSGIGSSASGTALVSARGR